MVKVLVNGGLFEISKIEEIVEKRVPFNGTNIRLVQIAKDSKQAVSGLHFQVKNTECNVFAIGEFTIGNLPTAKVKEIMKQLLSDGYYDFSDCDFQPMMFVEKYKFDEGKSKPYFCQGSLIQFYAPNDVFNYPANTIVPPVNIAAQDEFGDEKDDLSDMSDLSSHIADTDCCYQNLFVSGLYSNPAAFSFCNNSFLSMSMLLQNSSSES